VPGPAPTATEVRLAIHAVCSRAYLYQPVVVHHIGRGLEAAGATADHAWALAILSLFALGMAVAEFPSGVFADWAGRVRAVQACGLCFAAGMLCYLWPERLWLVAVGQLVLGVGTGFLTGADTALLHQRLELTGRGEQFGRKLARLRFWNAVGLVAGPGVGGFLYEWWWPSVWLGTIALQLAGIGVMQGIAEPPRPHVGRRYWHVFGDAVRFAGRDRRFLAMLAVAGAGTALYSFAIWTIQIHLRAEAAPPRAWGLAVAACWTVAAAAQPISAWLGHTPARSARAWPWLLAVLPVAFAGVWLAQVVDRTLVASAVIVAAAGATTIYRNACNVHLQHLAPDALRASIVSLWNWLGSLWYLACFPLFGWCLDRHGPVAGYGWIAASCGALVGALLLGAALAGVWRGNPNQPSPGGRTA
jgi:MFS family permease